MTFDSQNVWLAESGSTKTDWVCLSGPAAGQRLHTPGFNPSYAKPGVLEEELTNALTGTAATAATHTLYFYGAGCSSPDAKARMAAALKAATAATHIEVKHDLLAAARGLLGQAPGIVCILGTGSHACTYLGGEIILQASSLGYLLGDEGGGVSLGKALVRDFFYHQMPPEVAPAFGAYLALSRDEVIDRLYRQPWPNRWLASLTSFLTRPEAGAYETKLVKEQLEAFLQAHVLPLAKLTPGLPVAATGSIAWHFRHLWAEGLDGHGLQNGPVLPSPLEGLMQYHSRH